MRVTHLFHNTVFVVTPNAHHTMLVSGHPQLLRWMDGDSFEDNFAPEKEDTFPKEAGVYIGTLEYWFEQGYYEGYKADGESEFGFGCRDCKLLALNEQMPSIEEVKDSGGYFFDEELPEEFIRSLSNPAPAQAEGERV